MMIGQALFPFFENFAVFFAHTRAKNSRKHPIYEGTFLSFGAIIGGTIDEKYNLPLLAFRFGFPTMS